MSRAVLSAFCLYSAVALLAAWEARRVAVIESSAREVIESVPATGDERRAPADSARDVAGDTLLRLGDAALGEPAPAPGDDRVVPDEDDR